MTLARRTGGGAQPALHEQPSPIRERSSPAVREARTAGESAPFVRQGLNDLPRGLAVGAAGGLFLSLTGAFGTGEAPVGVRTAY